MKITEKVIDNPKKVKIDTVSRFWFRGYRQQSCLYKTILPCIRRDFEIFTEFFICLKTPA